VIGSYPVDTADAVDLESLTPRERVGGKARCPKAIPMRRAWRFVDSPKLPENIEKRLALETGAAAVALTPVEADCILALQAVPVFESAIVQRAERGADMAYLQASMNLIPSPQGEIFAFRFGNRDVWKIGNSFDPQCDIEGINRNVPISVIHEAWEMHCRASAGTKTEATLFEMRLGESLADYRISGDVFICPQTAFEQAWKFALSEVRGFDSR
jgi:hypothetical protein